MFLARLNDGDAYAALFCLCLFDDRIKILVPFEKSAIRPSLVMIFVGIPLGAALSFSALYGKELGVGNGALFLTCFAISMFISRPISGRLIDRFGFHKIIYLTRR